MILIVALNGCEKDNKHGSYDYVADDLGRLRGSGECVDGLIFDRSCLHLNYNDVKKIFVIKSSMR